ncbi:bombyxin B-2 [Nephila pilipes]|uniref:Bombyxin B-2 n=1 Tax=Nephila pilipes TaxID=299642 RepID=A0A8X6MND4_NEPPI|nr:bombyxin B-2 [Nephila pilipes]
MICSYFKVFLLNLALISLFQINSVQSVRICGKRLADFLHYMCRHHGGFHAPENKRADLYPRQVAEESALEQSIQQNYLSTVLESGVVDECCRKQCTLSTLISYCADGEQVGADRLSELESLFSSNLETITENQMRENTMEIMTELPGSARNSDIQDNTGANIPNIGTNRRNRPVFIVLP